MAEGKIFNISHWEDISEKRFRNLYEKANILFKLFSLSDFDFNICFKKWIDRFEHEIVLMFRPICRTSSMTFICCTLQFMAVNHKNSVEKLGTVGQ